MNGSMRCTPPPFTSASCRGATFFTWGAAGRCWRTSPARGGRPSGTASATATSRRGAEGEVGAGVVGRAVHSFMRASSPMAATSATAASSRHATSHTRPDSPGAICWWVCPAGCRSPSSCGRGLASSSCPSTLRDGLRCSSALKMTSKRPHPTVEPSLTNPSTPPSPASASPPPPSGLATIRPPAPSGTPGSGGSGRSMRSSIMRFGCNTSDRSTLPSCRSSASPS